MKRVLTALTLAIVGLGLAGCDVPVQAQSQPTNIQQALKGQRAADAIQFTSNAEQNNILHRLKLTSQPGLLGYVLLFNPGTGNPAMYVTVKGKITSGGKKLHNPTRFVTCDLGEYSGSCQVPAPNDEGTYGESGDYIYFWTEDGQYIQWNGNYLYSDKPFRIPRNSALINLVDK